MTGRRPAANPATTNKARKTRATAAQAYGDEVWKIVDRAGDAGALRDDILLKMGGTPSQFERAKGFIRDLKAIAEGKAFLAYRGTYVTTIDPNRCAEYVGWRLRGIDRELRRMLSGAIEPLGERVEEHDVLRYYQREIHHMLDTVDDMRKLGFPVSSMPAGAPTT